MQDRTAAGTRRRHCHGLPQPPEVRAGLLEPGHQGAGGRFGDTVAQPVTELAEDRGCLRLPLRRKCPAPFIHEGQPQKVPVTVRQASEIPAQHLVSPVPGDHVETPVGQHRRIGVELREQDPMRRPALVRMGGLTRRGHMACELKEMSPLRRVESEDAAEPREHAPGHADLPRLLQPGVPSRADTGESGDLLPTQARCTALPQSADPHVRRLPPGSPVPQKVGQLDARRAGRSRHIHGTHLTAEVRADSAKSGTAAVNGAASTPSSFLSRVAWISWYR